MWALSQTVRVLSHPHCSSNNYFSISVIFFSDMTPHFLSAHDSPSNLAIHVPSMWPLIFGHTRFTTSFAAESGQIRKNRTVSNLRGLMNLCTSNIFIPKLILRLPWFFRRTEPLFSKIRTFPQLFRFCSDLGNSGIRQIVRNSVLTGC